MYNMEMDTIDQQIEEIQVVLRKTPHHKATNGFIGQMRAKIARLRDKQSLAYDAKEIGGGGGGGFTVKKQGDATVVLIGPPSAGKSTLLNSLTNAESKVAPYAFTTVTVIPGMLKYNDAYIQILDIPGLIEGASKGKGRGKEVISVIRGSDLLLLMTDTQRIGLIDTLKEELHEAGIRINETIPNISISKKTQGGIQIQTNIKQQIGKLTIKEMAMEFGIRNADIVIKERLTFDRLIDAFSENRLFVPALVVVNKIDLQSPSSYKSSNPEKPIFISAEKAIGREELK